MLSTLGICRKAGKLIMGFDAVVKEMQAPKSKLAGVITASDLSPKTLKELNFQAEKCSIRVVPSEAAMEEIEAILGKRTGILGILDEGLFLSLAGLNK